LFQEAHLQGSGAPIGCEYWRPSPTTPKRLFTVLARITPLLTRELINLEPAPIDHSFLFSNKSSNAYYCLSQSFERFPLERLPLCPSKQSVVGESVQGRKE